MLGLTAAAVATWAWVAALFAARGALEIYQHWGGIAAFFKSVWGAVTSFFSAAIGVIRSIASGATTGSSIPGSKRGTWSSTCSPTPPRRSGRRWAATTSGVKTGSSFSPTEMASAPSPSLAWESF